MSWFDDFIFGIRAVYRNGVALPTRQGIDFVGAEVEDDPVLKLTRVTTTGAIGTFPNNGQEWAFSTASAGVIASKDLVITGTTAVAIIVEARIAAIDLSNGAGALWIVEHAASCFGVPPWAAIGSSTARLTRLSAGAAAAATPTISFSSLSVRVNATNWAAHDIRWGTSLRITAGGG